MLQRIQTLFLLLALPMSLLIWLESMAFARLSGDLTPLSPPDGTLLADGSLHGTEHIALLTAMLLPSLFCLIAVFLYRNRPLQLRLAALAAILFGAAMLMATLFLYLDYRRLADVERHFAIGPGMLLPLAGMVLCLLAIRFIRKDDRLVRSMDRLR